MTVRVDLNLSLDGIAAPADMSPENPMGADWGLLVADYMATRTFRERVFDTDVRVGGGVSTVRSALAAGLVDRLHVAIRPVILGRGTRLWDDLEHLHADYRVTSEVAESGVVHVTFER
ncbi:dihydrofolate reductase family protein [Microbacterium sp. NPDC016588]